MLLNKITEQNGFLRRRNPWLGAVVAVLGCVAGLFFCARTPVRLLDPATDVAHTWYRYGLEIEPLAEGFRAPVAARMYGYIGLAAYEAALPALGQEYQSIAALFPTLDIPLPRPDVNYYMPAILHGCYATLFEKFYAMASNSQITLKRKALESELDDRCKKTTDLATFIRSKLYGEAVARAVFEWSATDSLGHDANLHLYDKSYTPPPGEGKWKPCLDFPLPALLPNWQKLRTFVIKPDDFAANPHSPYSTDPNSSFYKQALEIYTISAPLSSENLWIAEFWSDDQPGLTFSAASRWISIVCQVIEQENPSAAKTLETYLKVGFALNDAMVACWQSKYRFNLERPESYIARVFDSEWRPIHHTPPFPSYPSGHAMLGAVTAEVLTQLYGNQFAMTDRSHKGRTEFKGMPRSFNSFYEMANECAYSRIPLGVHFRMDCDEGVRLGLLIGKSIGALRLDRNKKVSGFSGIQ